MKQIVVSAESQQSGSSSDTRNLYCSSGFRNSNTSYEYLNSKRIPSVVTITCLPIKRLYPSFNILP